MTVTMMMMMMIVIQVMIMIILLQVPAPSARSVSWLTGPPNPPLHAHDDSENDNCDDVN